MKALIVLLICIVIAIVAALCTAPAYILMWGWFVTPTFGVAAPSLPMMVGLAMFIQVLLHSSTEDDKAKELDEALDEAVRKTFFRIITVWLVTGISFFWSLFV